MESSTQKAVSGAIGIPLDEVNLVTLEGAADIMTRLMKEVASVDEIARYAKPCGNKWNYRLGLWQSCTLPAAVEHTIHVSHGGLNRPLMAWVCVE